MSTEPVIVPLEGFKARNRLADLGLTEESLLRAVQRGNFAWKNCTPNHPPLFPGILRWAETVVALREELIPDGWQRSDEGNLPFTINKEGTVAVSVASGDEATGQPDKSPCTRSSKGPRTAKAVAVNHHQYNLFGEIRLCPEDVAQLQDQKRMTWILLFHYDIASSELRCELSRPLHISGEGIVDGWTERLILTATPWDEGLVERTPEADGPQSPDVVVEVKRRSA